MIKTLTLCATAVLVVLAASSPASALCVAPKKLSNMYKANDGGTYFVRRVGNDVYWVGESADDGRTWTNVFKGTLNGNTFSGGWADVAGNIGGSGTLTLRILGSIATASTSGRMRGVPQSEALHVVERFRRVDARTISYTVTVEDPNVYTAPWTVSMPLTRDDDYRIYEYACHEANYGVANILRGARAEERR